MSDNNNPGGRWNFRRGQQQPTTQPGSSSSGHNCAEVDSFGTASAAAGSTSTIPSPSPSSRPRPAPTQGIPTTAAPTIAAVGPPSNLSYESHTTDTSTGNSDSNQNSNSHSPNNNSRNKHQNRKNVATAVRDVPTPVPDLSNLRRGRTLQGNGLFGHTDNVRRSTSNQTSGSIGSGGSGSEQHQQQPQHQTLYPDPNVPSVRHFLVNEEGSDSTSANPSATSASASAAAAAIRTVAVTATLPVEQRASIPADNNNHPSRQQHSEEEEEDKSTPPVVAGQRKPDMDDDSINVPTQPGRRQGVQVQAGGGSGQRVRNVAFTTTAPAKTTPAVATSVCWVTALGRILPGLYPKFGPTSRWT